MLTKADEYPFHQTPEPMAFSGSDRNFYDRFWFGGYTKDRSVFFTLAFGLYPQLNIMDSSFCVRYQGKQHNVRASKYMNGERSVLNVGPISIDIIEPLKSSKITINDEEHDIYAELTFNARHQPIKEPRFTRRIGTRTFMDYTRMTQNVCWSGYIKIAGETIELQPEFCMGTRDRSWGIRPVGAPDSQPAQGSAEWGKQFFWLWTPVNFDDHVTFSHTIDTAEGEPWNRRAVVQDLSGEAVDYDSVQYEYTWRPGTRRIDTLTSTMQLRDKVLTLRYKTYEHFYMSGLGYFHPEWGHGMDKGPLAIGYDVINLDKVDDSEQINLHIQALSKVELDIDGKTVEGTGLVEQMFIGANNPIGLLDDNGPAVEVSEEVSE